MAGALDTFFERCIGFNNFAAPMTKVSPHEPAEAFIHSSLREKVCLSVISGRVGVTIHQCVLSLLPLALLHGTSFVFWQILSRVLTLSS